MDNAREKLAKLIEESRIRKTENEGYCICGSHIIADHLLANGVMFQRYAQWEDVTKIGSFCYAYCSNCCTEHKAPNYAALAVQHRFCRWCGARMVHQPPKGDSV